MKTRMQIVIEIDFDEEPNREWFKHKVFGMVDTLDVGRVVYIAVDNLSSARTLKDSR